MHADPRIRTRLWYGHPVLRLVRGDALRGHGTDLVDYYWRHFDGRWRVSDRPSNAPHPSPVQHLAQRARYRRLQRPLRFLPAGSGLVRHGLGRTVRHRIRRGIPHQFLRGKLGLHHRFVRRRAWAHGAIGNSRGLPTDRHPSPQDRHRFARRLRKAPRGRPRIHCGATVLRGGWRRHPGHPPHRSGHAIPRPWRLCTPHQLDHHRYSHSHV